jgi:hypothetical protein
MRKLLICCPNNEQCCPGLRAATCAGRSGDVAAGDVGGLAIVTLFGAAVASGPRYYAPAPLYVAPAPVYVDRHATGPEAPPFGTDIEAFGTGRPSTFATEVHTRSTAKNAAGLLA